MAKAKEVILADSGVIYEPVGHTYTLSGKRLQGITTTLINRAYPTSQTYSGVSEEVLNHAAERGSACHQAVGNYYEIGFASTGFETVVDEAKRLLESQGLTPIRFEYVVTDYEHYASPIDIVCVNDKDEICIVDMKFTSKLHYEQVSLQTSIYKRFFHLVNPKLDAKGLYVLWVHTNDSLEVIESGIYELSCVEDAFIDDLIKADIADKPFDVTKYYGTLPETVGNVEEYLVQLSTFVKEKTEEMNRIKDGLCKLMQDNGVQQYDSRLLRLTAVRPKPKNSFDTTKFKKEHPDLYSQYIKTSDVSPFVRITIK